MTRSAILLTCTLLLVALLASHAGGTSTQVTIQKIAADGITVLNETTVDYRWMEQHLPVLGDGTTHYYLQGPIFVDNPEDRWNPAEDINVKEKDMGAVKGTALADLCDLAGGMADGDTVEVQASDGFKKTFAYDNVYSPPSRQGPVVLAWYEGSAGYVPAYADGMRLLFMADTSGNPWGIHAMGVWDWHESAGEEYWYYYYNGNEMYPTTTGLSVRSVSAIRIYSQQEPAGTIRVTSQPAGARIVIDGDEMQEKTPADFTGVPPGTYAVRVEVEGYEVPEEVLVEVQHLQVSEVHVDLVHIPADPDTGVGGSSDSPDDEGDIVSGTAGSELALLLGKAIPGDVSLSVIPGLEGSMRGGEHRSIVPGVIPADRNHVITRLYIFLSNCSDTRTGTGVVPACELVGKGISIPPDRVYRDQGGNPSGGMIVTAVFPLQDTPPNLPDLSLHIVDGPGISCQVQGGALIALSRDQVSPVTSTWIFEGADLISAPPGADRPDAETSAGFDLDADGPVYSQGTLRFVTTTGAGYQGGRYQVQLNGEMHTGVTSPEKQSVEVAELRFEPPSPGSPVTTAIRATMNDTSGLYGETRLCIFTMSGNPPGAGHVFNRTAGLMVTAVPTATDQSPVVQATTIPDTSEVPGGLVQRTTGTSAGDLTVHGGEVGIPIIPASTGGTGKKGPLFWLAPVTDRITAILSLLFGEPAGAGTGGGMSSLVAGDGGPARTVPGVPGSTGGDAQGTTGESAGTDIPVQDPPDGSNHVTEHSTRDIGDSAAARDSSPPNDPPPDISIKPADTDMDDLYTGDEQIDAPSPQNRNRTRHGGVYITSYPEDVEVRIDNKLMSTHLPAVLYGLKEGSHLVDVRLKSESGAILGAQSARVFVPADAITTAQFDLVRMNNAENARVVAWNGSLLSFTVNGYYPLRKTPADIDFSGPDAFITVSRDNAFLSLTSASNTNGTIVVPGSMPPLYRLQVISDPAGGDIWIDGIRTGLRTPAIVPNLSAGPHRVTVHLPGHIPGDQVFLIPVDDGPDVKRRISYVLETYPCGPLFVSSVPGGGAITLDGINTGEKTPFTFEHIPLGIHVVTVTRNGESRKADVIVQPGAGRQYVIEFEGNGTKEG